MRGQRLYGMYTTPPPMYSNKIRLDVKYYNYLSPSWVELNVDLVEWLNQNDIDYMWSHPHWDERGWGCKVYLFLTSDNDECLFKLRWL